MSFESPGFSATRAAAPQRTSLYADARAPHGRGSGYLPDDTRLSGWLARTLGVAILALSALFVLALLTWSVADPSFSNSGAGQALGSKPKNALGPIGAILSDIVVQSLGLASVFALLPPVFWAAQLLSRHGIEGARSKLAMAPISVLCLAAFLSGLPKAPSWPLGAGYGGLLGDFGFQFVTGLFGIVNAERAPLVTGVCLMAAGFSLLMLSLGLTPMDLKRIAERRRTHVPDSGWVSHLKGADVTSTSDEDVLAAGPVAQQASLQHAPIQQHQVNQPSASNLPTPAAQSSPQASSTPALISVGASVAAHSALRAQVVAEAPVRHQGPHNGQVPSAPSEAPAPAPVRAPAPVCAPATQPTPNAPQFTYRRPPLSLLPQSTASRAQARDQHIAEKLRARKLTDVLETFGVRVEMKGHVVGPVVTTFTIEPAAGTKSSRIIGLADDIARGLDVPSVRIQVAAARTAITIEIPHDEPAHLGLRDFVEHKSFQATASTLPLVLGATATGEPCVADLADAAVLVTGFDPAMRAALLDTAVASLVYRHVPTMLRLALLGPADGAPSAWTNLPHLAVPPACGPTKAAELLSWAAAEIDARSLRMRAVAQSQTIDAYNQRLRTQGGTDAAPMPYLVLVVGDLVEILRDAPPATTAALDAILRRGKAVGVHIIAAISAAGDDVSTQSLVAAFPVRIAAQVSSKAESRAVIGEIGAEDLPASGDVLVYAGTETLRRYLGGGLVHRLHTALIRSSEAKAIATAAAMSGAPVSEPYPAAHPDTSARGLQDTLQRHWTAVPSDSLYDRAVDVVRREQSADAGVLKHELSLTYGMASELLEQMARNGLLSTPDASGVRRVLMGRAA